MKTLVYASLALGVVGHAGCVIVTDSTAEIEVVWTIDGEFEDGDGCATLGATGVEVVTEDLTTGDRDINIFDCSDGGATVSRPLGDYDVWTNAIDDEERILGNSPIDFDVSLNSSNELVALEEYAFQNGQFEAAWLLTDDASDEAVRCGDVGLGGISFLTTLAGSGGTGFDDVFECPVSDTEGVIRTDRLPLGDYTVDMSVLDSQSDEARQSITESATIDEHATIVNLGIFEFFF